MSDRIDYFDDVSKLIQMTFVGDFIKDDISFVFNNDQSFKLNATFFDVNDLFGNVKSKFDGFIGLAPYTSAGTDQ